MTAQDTALLLARLGAAYPRWTPTADTAAVYAAGLADLWPEDAQSAADAWIRTGKYPPSVAELREQALDALQARRQRAAGDRPLLGDGQRPCPEAQVALYREQIAAFGRGEIDGRELIREATLIATTAEPPPPRHERDLLWQAADASIAWIDGMPALRARAAAERERIARETAARRAAGAPEPLPERLPPPVRRPHPPAQAADAARRALQRPGGGDAGRTPTSA